MANSLAFTKELRQESSSKKAASYQKKSTSVLNISKHLEFAKLLTTQTEEIEEIKTNLCMQLKKMNCENGEDIGRLQKNIPAMENTVQEYAEQEKRHIAELSNLPTEFFETKDKAQL